MEEMIDSAFLYLTWETGLVKIDLLLIKSTYLFSLFYASAI